MIIEFILWKNKKEVNKKSKSMNKLSLLEIGKSLIIENALR